MWIGRTVISNELAIDGQPEPARPLASKAFSSAEVEENTLPDQPLFTITPSRGWVSLNLRELWAYRELLYFLTWRDIKVRYKQTMLGVASANLERLSSELFIRGEVGCES